MKKKDIIAWFIIFVIFGLLLSTNPWNVYGLCKFIKLWILKECINIWHNPIFSTFFVDKDGKFLWIGITSVLAIATLTFNAWDRRRQFNADLKSKSRIKWIENVRVAYSELVDNIMITDNDESRSKDVTKNVTLLSLYFGDDKLSDGHLNQIFGSDKLQHARKSVSDFCIIIDKNIISDDLTPVDECWNVVEKILVSNDNEGKNFILKRCFVDLGRQSEGYAGNDEERATLLKKINKVTEWLSLYLHLEWERAKRGE